MAEPVQLVLKERAQDRDTERNRQQTRLLTLPFSLAFTALPRPACTLHAMYTLSHSLRRCFLCFAYQLYP